jgi:hypothetical protein
MDLKNAEILAVGTWEGSQVVTFDESTLDDMVRAFAALNQAGRVPLKLGHNAEQSVTDGHPALGWVQRVWRDGQRLLADFTDIPTIVYEAIRKGLYKFVSSEVLLDSKVGGESFAAVLDAVALLGADIPAVSNLKDLQSLTMARRLEGITFAQRVVFSRRESPTGDKKVMAEEKTDNDKLRDLTVAEVKIEAERKALDAEKAEFKRSQEAAAAAEKRATINKHRDERKAQFDRAVKEGRITSAQRDTGEKLLRFGDDAAVLGVTSADVDEAISAMAGKRGAASRAAFTRGGSQEERQAESTPGDELAEAIAEQQKEFEDKGKVWGPEDAAKFARANRASVRAWMDSIPGGR